MSEEAHVHKFNATIITTRQNPVLRCTCGVWATKKNIEAAKVQGGEPKLCTPRTIKGLETRLRNERKVDDTPWSNPPDRQPVVDTNYRPNSTAATDEVLRGRRKPT